MITSPYVETNPVLLSGEACLKLILWSIRTFLLLPAFILHSVEQNVSCKFNLDSPMSLAEKIQGEKFLVLSYLAILVMLPTLQHGESGGIYQTTNSKPHRKFQYISCF